MRRTLSPLSSSSSSFAPRTVAWTAIFSFLLMLKERIVRRAKRKWKSRLRQNKRWKNWWIYLDRLQLFSSNKKMRCHRITVFHSYFLHIIMHYIISRVYNGNPTHWPPIYPNSAAFRCIGACNLTYLILPSAWLCGSTWWAKLFRLGFDCKHFLSICPHSWTSQEKEFCFIDVLLHLATDWQLTTHCFN